MFFSTVMDNFESRVPGHNAQRRHKISFYSRMESVKKLFGNIRIFLRMSEGRHIERKRVRERRRGRRRGRERERENR